MKKFLWACALALPLAAVSQQTASAGGFEINWGGGFNFHWTFGINCGHCCQEWSCAKGYDDGYGSACSYGGYGSDCSYGGSYMGDSGGVCMDGFNGMGYGYAALPSMAQPTGLYQAMPQPPVNYG